MVGRQTESQANRRRRYRIDGAQATVTCLPILLEKLALSDLDLMIIQDLVRYGPDPDDGGLVAMLGLMLAALSDGSLCLDIDRDHLQRTVLPDTDPAVSELISGFVGRLHDGRYDNLVDRNGSGAFKPIVLDDTTGRSLLYFQKFHYHEQRLKRRLQSFMRLPEKHDWSDDHLWTVIDALYRDGAAIRKGVGQDPIVRDPDQVNAIRAALTAPLLVISGGPGTGKTSLLVNILRALVRTGTDPSRILLAASTGRAAQRMTEALMTNLATIADPDRDDLRLSGLIGSTLHKLLVYRSRTGSFLYGERRFVPADVIVVDEVSMVDVVMMDRFFQAIDPDRTRLILLGDKDQLPSVEAGSVLADMSPAADSGAANHFVALHNVYRSAGQLLELAQAINAGHAVPLKPVSFDEALALDAGRWAFVAAGDEQARNRRLDQWLSRQYLQGNKNVAESYADLLHQVNRLSDTTVTIDSDQKTALLGRLFAFAFRCRILTLLRHGRSGARWINDRIAAGLRHVLDPGSDPNQRLFNGALMMISRNDYPRGLYNGDVGVVLRQPDGLYRVYFKRSDKMVAFPAAGIADWDLAFAMTVHKSQGSEFEDALLFLPEDPGNRLLTREIIYTAATRASQRLIVIGTGLAFKTALNRKIKRQSGLMLEAH